MDEVLSPIGFFGLLILFLLAFTCLVIGAGQMLGVLADFVEWRREKRAAKRAGALPTGDFEPVLSPRTPSTKIDGQ